ncbi:MAG: SurA N-terminal domain-containing protein [Rickettsiales bacterium]|nr:SurA N-terminal domain-containing protein [Pseudomonadota bacterium]MDA0966277.1 SurA N-terminal domain-containing protein [Pseudomonadota bacterium]MDG4543058.1 SurA N-terminal domain-containing protein [Rickettsiales bacterium]MDG4545256.1 SurA N-terminal domain-containing protein [Rickettsiales bacterium]MDG4547705.1 SurA N-terminal domain-containing protein [Rickettsiales bacterium]
MLEAMRKGSQNIFVKLLLGVLALSFVVWGVGDVFRGGSSTTIAKVGDEKIGYEEYYNSLQREISRFQQILGTTLTPELMQQFDVKRRVFDQMVDNKLIRLRVGELNLKVGDNVVRDIIARESAFYDESGKFNPENFKMVLQYNGLDEKQYVKDIKDEAAIGILVDTLAVSPSSMKNTAKTLYRYRNEYRTAELIYIPTDYVKEMEEPSEADLIQYYQDNSNNFAVPESRTVTYLTYGYEDVKNSVQVSEEAMKAEYEDNIESFTEPEKRDVVQYLFEKEEDAQKALEDINEGKVSLYDDKKIELGEVRHDELPEDVVVPVFALEVGQYSESINTDLGWHIFTINKISEPQGIPFEEVRGEIEDYLKDVKAAEIFEQSSIKIEDELAAGNKLEDIAKKFDLVIHSIPSINSNAQGSSGKPLTDIPDPQTLADVAFSVESGEVSSMTLLSDNSTYVLVRVDNVVPQRVKALDEVKGTVTALWKESQKRKKLMAIAEQVAIEIKGGKAPKELASSMGLKFKMSDEIKRPSPDAFLDNEGGVPAQLSLELFGLKKGESTSYYLSDKGEYVMGKLADIKDSQVDKGKLANLEESLKRDFTDDILRQYNYFLRKQYPVEENENMLNSLSL